MVAKVTGQGWTPRGHLGLTECMSPEHMSVWWANETIKIRVSMCEKKTELEMISP